jgi:hypothetical protein
MKKYAFLVSILLMLQCISVTLSAQVVVTAATGGLLICTNTAAGGSAPGPTTLDTFKISEAHSAENSIKLSPVSGMIIYEMFGILLCQSIPVQNDNAI